MQDLILILSIIVFAILLPAMIFRKTGFEVQAVLVLVRTKKGLMLLDKLAGRKKWWDFFADMAIITSLGVAGAALIGKKTGEWNKTILKYTVSLPLLLLLTIPFSGRLVIMLFTMFFGVSFFILAGLALNSTMIIEGYLQGVPQSPGVVPIIPGVGNVPLYAVISLLILLVVHELSHGIVARAQNIRVKSLGVLLLGLIPIGAFTEPDEDELKSTMRLRRMRVYAAGSMANFVTAGVFYLLLLGSMLTISGYSLYGVPVFDGQRTAPFPIVISNDLGKQEYLIQYVENNSPAQHAGLAPGMVIQNPGALFNKSPGQEITLFSNKTRYTLTTNENGMIGVSGSIIPKYSRYSLTDWAVVVSVGVIAWTFMLNYLIGMVNLLPFWMLDGYKLVEDALDEYVGRAASPLLKVIASTILLFFVINAIPWFVKV